MRSHEIIVLNDVALITCVVQKGLGDQIAKAAKDAGAQGVTIHYAHGMGIKERLGVLGVAVNTQKEVLYIIVSEEQTERVFRAMCIAGKLDTPGMGIIYVTKLEKAATFIPANILNELERA